ncbi:MAG: oligosaccharide flippase family protein [Bacteroidia bacterium]
MYFNKTFKTDIAKNIIALTSATVIAQIVNFLFNIFLTRLYTPEEFGSLSIFLSLISFITVLSTAKFDVAIVASSSNEDAQKLFSLSFFVLLLITIISSLVISIVYLFNLSFYKGTEVHNWLFFLIPSVVMLTGTQICWMWNVRNKNFKKIAFVRIVEAVFNGSISVLLVSMCAKGLLFGVLFGQLSCFLILLYIVFSTWNFSTFVFPFHELKKTFIRYIQFPKINVLQGFLEIFQVSSFVILLANSFNSTIVGLYALGMRVLQVPARLLVLPISHVFFAEASEIYRNGGSLYRIVKKTIYKTALVALPLPIILFIAGPILFSFVFGKNWAEAGEYARIFSFWIFFDLIKAPVIQVASIVGKQHYILIFSILTSIIFLISFLGSVALFHNITATLWIVSISQSIMTFFLILIILKISK